MLTRNDYLGIKRSLVEELFMPFLTEERRTVILETFETISSYIDEKDTKSNEEN